MNESMKRAKENRGVLGVKPTSFSRENLWEGRSLEQVILPSLHNRTHAKVKAWSRWSARTKICFNWDKKLTTKWIRDASNNILRDPTCPRSRSRKPQNFALQKPVIRKNKDRVLPTKCSGATFGVWRLIYKQQKER